MSHSSKRLSLLNQVRNGASISVVADVGSDAGSIRHGGTVIDAPILGSTETCRLQSGVGFLWKLMHRTAGSQRKILNMKRVIAATLMAGVVSLGMVGCTEKTASTKQETKIKTPGGTTTITTEKEVKKTGDNPPATTP